MKKPSHNQVMKAELRYTMWQVMKLLRWTELEYCMFKYLCGLEYLGHYLEGDVDSIRCMEGSPYFWGWWKLQWHSREKDFLEMVYLVPQKPNIIFEVMNDPKELADVLTPNGRLMDDSYSADLVPKLR